LWQASRALLETELYQDMVALDRCKWWAILLIGSIVLLFSIMERNPEERVEMSLVATSAALASLGLFSSLMPRRLCIFRLESLLIWIMTIFWVATAVFARILPTNSEESIEANLIAHSNQFFFSYLCLTASVVLIANWFKNEVQVDDSVTTTQWIMLCASSFVVMISAIGFRDRRLDIPPVSNETSTTPLDPHFNITINITTLPDTNSDPFNLTHFNATNITTDTIRTSFCAASEAFSCSRVEFAIVLGGLSAGCALGMALSTKSCSPVGCVVDLALLWFVAWGCGIVYLTFAQGPGFTLGTIYFGSFVSLFLCLDILLVSLSQQVAIETEREKIRNDHFREQYANELRSEGAEEFAHVSIDDVLNESRFRSPGPSRNSTHGPNRQMNMRSINYRGMSGSVFESVGAWRGSTIINMEGERIPSDIANPSGITDNDSFIETRDIRRVELWIVLLITSIVCMVAIQQLVPSALSRESTETVALAMPALSLVAAFAGIIACARPGRKARLVELALVSGTHNVLVTCIERVQLDMF
jgi:hypothetical protein